MHFHSLLSV